MVKYNRMSEHDVSAFEEIFSTFQDLIIAMVRNAVRVLPNDKNNPIPSIVAHSKIKSSNADVSYDNVIDIKDIFLSCVPDEAQRNIFDKTVNRFTLDGKKKIRFFIKRAEYEKLDIVSKQSFTQDVKKLEKIINSVNDNFNVRLPEAKRQGMLMISKIKNLDIPDKAKFQSRRQEKHKGREI